MNTEDLNAQIAKSFDLKGDSDNTSLLPRAYVEGMGRAARRRELRQKRKTMELSIGKKFPLGSRHSRRLFSRLNLVAYAS